MTQIPVIICIDVEPDDRELDEFPRDWYGFENTFKFFNGIRPRLEEVTGAPASFCWFLRMDPQVKHIYGQYGWVADRYGEIINQLQQDGDEIGLHTHAWRWDDPHQRWVIDHGDQEWVEHCMRVSFEAFEKAFGRPCRSFRFGDHWMNNETMDLLETMGVEFDLTIEPGRDTDPQLRKGELHTGSFPDYTAAPRFPYRPSRHDFRKHKGGAHRGLWAIPLNTGKMPGRFPVVKQAIKALGFYSHKDHPVPLNLSVSGRQFREMLTKLMTGKSLSYLTPVMRSDGCLTRRSKADVERNLNFLLSHPLASDFRFVTPAAAIKLLDAAECFDKGLFESTLIKLKPLRS
jgi:hypothetical protein